MDEWRKFYEKHEEYEFLGVLEGDYYDSKGKETSYLLEIKETVESARIIALEEEAKRKEEQLKRRATRLARAREKEAQEEAAEF
jgi:tRNA(Ser,Leu) C12 N-acetylase TAN1